MCQNQADLIVELRAEIARLTRELQHQRELAQEAEERLASYMRGEPDPEIAKPLELLGLLIEDVEFTSKESGYCTSCGEYPGSDNKIEHADYCALQKARAALNRENKEG